MLSLRHQAASSQDHVLQCPNLNGALRSARRSWLRGGSILSCRIGCLRSLRLLFYVGLTHGSVSHSRTPASRSSGGFMIPTTPCPPELVGTCRTSTVCLLPRR